MTTTVNFVFLREGSSDEALIPHLSDLLLRAGADEATGTARPYRGNVESKLRLLRAEPGSVHLAFVHRDSDAVDHKPRYEEIRRAVRAVEFEVPVIAVVPVQEIEAWLLVDESAIRSVVGRPHGTSALGLPALGDIESTNSPKELLRRACLLASDSTGRRHDREKTFFDRRRRTLLERLNPDGPIRSLPAWQRLRSDIKIFVESLQPNHIE